MPSELGRYLTPCGWAETPSGVWPSPDSGSSRIAASVDSGMSLTSVSARQSPSHNSMVGPGMDAVSGDRPYPSRTDPSAAGGNCTAYMVKCLVGVTQPSGPGPAGRADWALAPPSDDASTPATRAARRGRSL